MTADFFEKCIVDGIVRPKAKDICVNITQGEENVKPFSASVLLYRNIAYN